MPFYLAILAATFGKGSHQPVLAASMRLACLFLGAVGLGSLIGHSLGSAPSAATLPFWHIAPYATFAVEAVVAFSLLSTVGLWQAKGNLHRLLQSWPLTAWQRIVADILPYGIVVAIALALSLPVLGKVFMALGLQPASLSFCTLLGIGAAGGLFAITAARMWVGIFITPITLWIQYQVLTYVQSTAYTVGTRQ
ncbi:MAG TPA: hypothetical protein VIR03_00115, partial [Candidatus Saccharimonadales bacterium]